MMDQELKKKIINTISKYELRCDKLQVQIGTFKQVINQLIISSTGFHSEMDGPIVQLQEQLDAEFDLKIIEKKAKRLASVSSQIFKKKSEHARLITRLLRQGTDAIGQIANKSHDKRAVTRLQRMIDGEMENHDALLNFNEVLTQCVTSVVRELDKLTQELKSSESQELSAPEISIKVNDSLQQLLNHLSIPNDLDSKKEFIKTGLENKLTGENLSKIIDDLTELVVDAFNVEQNRFKGFLQQLTDQLYDFDIYLKNSVESHDKSSNESRQLENGIQEDINQIKNHLDSSTTIEELSGKVSQNLQTIGDRIKEYRANEDMRACEHDKQLGELRAKLADSERHTEEIKNLLSFQKYKINHDGLTGLPNKESYDEHMIDTFQRWKRNPEVLSLAVGDIDHFKQINDTFGHLAGDKVLKKVATIFRSSIREVDFIARIGGEEFVFIFEKTTNRQAHSVIEKLRKSIEECQFFYRDNKVCVTVSFGLTSIVHGDDIESLFIRADNAMYKAKNAGRNRVEIL